MCILVSMRAADVASTVVADDRHNAAPLYPTWSLNVLNYNSLFAAIMQRLQRIALVALASGLLEWSTGDHRSDLRSAARAFRSAMASVKFALRLS